LLSYTHLSLSSPTGITALAVAHRHPPTRVMADAAWSFLPENAKDRCGALLTGLC
jgi:hypothetical protein